MCKGCQCIVASCVGVGRTDAREVYDHHYTHAAAVD